MEGIMLVGEDDFTEEELGFLMLMGAGSEESAFNSMVPLPLLEGEVLTESMISDYLMLPDDSVESEVGGTGGVSSTEQPSVPDVSGGGGCDNISENAVEDADNSGRRREVTKAEAVPLIDKQNGKVKKKKKVLMTSNTKGDREKPAIPCQTCGKTFASNWSLGQHMVLHTGGKPCQCPVCPAVLKRFAYLTRHMRRCHPGIPIPPSEYMISRNRNALITAPNAANDVKPTSVEPEVATGTNMIISSYVTQEQVQRETGDDGVASVEPDSCGVVDKVGEQETREELEGTGRKPPSDVQIQNCKIKTSKPCPICGKGFARNYSLKKHLLVHIDESPQCPACPASIRNGHHLELHIKRHHPGIPIPPNENKGATTTVSLEVAPPETISNYVDQEQTEGETGTVPSTVSHHCKMTRKKINLKTCPTCGKRLKSRSLKQHMLIHGREKNHPGIPLPPYEGNRSDLKDPVLALKITDEEKNDDLNQEQAGTDIGNDANALCSGIPGVKFNNERTEKDATCSSGGIVTDPPNDNQNSQMEPAIRAKKHKQFPATCPACGRRFTQKSSLKMHMLEFHPGAQIPTRANKMNTKSKVSPEVGAERLSNYVQQKQTLKQGEIDGDSDVWARSDPSSEGDKITNEGGNDNTPAVTATHEHNETTVGSDVQASTQPGPVTAKKAKTKKRKNNKPAMCPTCGKTLTRKSDLLKHMLIHIGATHYKCPVCSVAYRQLATLKQHMGRKHPGIPIPTYDQKTILKAAAVALEVAKETTSKDVTREHAKTDATVEEDSSSSTEPDPGSTGGKVINGGRECEMDNGVIDSNMGPGHPTPVLPNQNNTTTLAGPEATAVTKSNYVKQEQAYSQTAISGNIGDADISAKPEPVDKINSKNTEKDNPQNTAGSELASIDKQKPCPTCGQRFTQNYLLKHMLIHTDQRPYPCPACPKKFTQYCTLKRHMRSHHPGIAIPPNVNRVIRKNAMGGLKVAKELTDNHVKLEPNEIKGTSTVTGGGAGPPMDKQNSISMMEALKTAGPSLYRKGPVACPICGKIVTSKYALLSHMLLHTGQKSYQCPSCPVTVRQHTHLKNHMRRHHPDVPIPPYENKIFKAVGRVPKVKRKMQHKNGEIPIPSVKTEGTEADRVTSGIIPTEPIGSCGKHEELETETGCDGSLVPLNVNQCVRATADWKDIDEDNDKTRKTVDKPNRKINRRGYSKKTSTTCPKCGKEFRQRTSMLTHMLIHAGVKPFNCPACPQAFRQHSHLKIHMGKYHPGEPVPPAKATKVSRKNIVAARELPEAEIDPPLEQFKLRKCQVEMSRWDLENDKPMSSSQIFQKFNSMVSLTQGPNLPLQVEADDGRKCRVSMDINLLAHFLQPMYPPPPPSMFPRVGDYLQSWQSPVQPQKTEPMTKTVEVKAESRSKTVDVKAEEGEKSLKKQFSCSKCAKSFSKKNALRLHCLRSRSCNASIESRSKKMVTRKDKRGGEGIFGCTVCGRKFKRLDIWKKHMQLHSVGEGKSHQCTVCHKYFDSVAYLTVHMRIHTGERPYACKICGKRSTQKSALTIHMRLHSGEKPYECLLKCGSRFAQLAALDNHMKRAHRGEWDCYRCKLCDASFPDESSLNEHSAASH